MPDPTVPYLTGDRGDTHFEDPLLGFNYMLELETKGTGYFTECSGVGSEHEVIEHKVVNKQGHEIVRKIPGRLKWQDITLKRGITSDLELWKWRQEVLQGDMKTARQNITITMLDRNYSPVAVWHFQNAWPSKLTGPSFKSDSNEFGVEELTIVHEGMHREA